jgi:hypothetical protein
VDMCRMMHACKCSPLYLVLPLLYLVCLLCISSRSLAYGIGKCRNYISQVSISSRKKATSFPLRKTEEEGEKETKNSQPSIITPRTLSNELLNPHPSLLPTLL